MPGVNYGTAQSQSNLMLQKVNRMIEKTQNLDKVLQRRFSTVTGDTIGLQAYRQEIQIEEGGVTYALQLDGGNYQQGTGAQYVQCIIAPVSIGHSISATKLAMMISKGGDKVVIADYVARLISGVKGKVAHKQNIYLQTYNDGKLATVDTSWNSPRSDRPAAQGRVRRPPDRLELINSLSCPNMTACFSTRCPGVSSE